MANGTGKPRPCMPDSLWSSLKNLTWNDSGFLESGTQKYLYVTQSEGSTACGAVTFYLTTDGNATGLIRAKMSSSDFSTLKGYTWDGAHLYWTSGATHYNLEVAKDTDGLYKIGLATTS
jgi:hypothetical protein